MDRLSAFARVTGWSCVAIGGLQLAGGTAVEPGMPPDPTVDSHVRFMGTAFIGYGLSWLSAAGHPEPDLRRMRVLAGLMGAGGVGRLITRATVGRPHRFHDTLLGVELAVPAAVELLARRHAGD